MYIEKNMGDVIEESFTQYAGAVLQSRAIVDVRDCLKPSARQIFYCLYTDKFLPTKPFKKTLKAIGSVSRLYIHGDSSAEGILMRSGQEFAMRYPLVEVEGNNGNLMSSGNWAAPRYTSARLSDFTTKLFTNIDKETIEDWRDNYDDTEKYPSVLPSKGFYNIVNGTSGIGIGAASSIPQFNIKDVNRALETLLLNPNAAFEELYCRPDFATGAYLINEAEVKEALKYGSKKAAKENNAEGASCKLRSKIDYDSKENCLIVTEIPYSVYTNTICGQLESILDSEDNPGIDRFNDLTGEKPFIKIYLKRGADPDRVTHFLYKNTSLQYHFAINMTMLDGGKYPKVFTWKEALQAHINHEIEIYTRGYNYDLRKIKERIHILEGLLICLASIDEVVATIKSSNSTADASNNLQTKFLLDAAQAKAVLDMKLSRLAHLEVQKIENEKSELESEQARIEDILANKDKFNNELIKEWKALAAKYGDDYRTKIITVQEPKLDEAPKPAPEPCVVILTEAGNIKRIPTASFKTSSRGAKGVKTQDDVVATTIKTNSIDSLLVFSDKGMLYKIDVCDIPIGTNVSRGVSLAMLAQMAPGEKVATIYSLADDSSFKYILFITKNGMAKKTLLSEYTKTRRKGGVAATKLKDGDALQSVVLLNDEDIILLTKKGFGIRCESSEFRAMGKITAGVKAITLSADDEVVSSLVMRDTKDKLAIFRVDGTAYTVSDEIVAQGRGGKGAIYSKTSIATGVMLNKTDNVLISGSAKNVVISAKDITEHFKGATGVTVFKNEIVSVTKI